MVVLRNKRLKTYNYGKLFVQRWLSPADADVSKLEGWFCFSWKVEGFIWHGAEWLDGKAFVLIFGSALTIANRLAIYRHAAVCTAFKSFANGTQHQQEQRKILMTMLWDFKI